MRGWIWLALAAPAWAHVVSMSSADLTIEGTRGRYELRMPLYEVTAVQHPETALFEHVRFAGAKLVKSECRADSSRDAYICSAEYAWASPPDPLQAECTLFAVTAPNHVHLLRVSMGDKRDQAMFDRSATTATLRFRPPTAGEVAMTEVTGGFLRALAGPVQILFLAALVLASRSRGELFRVAAMFLAGQAAAVLIVPATTWEPAPRFVETAAALAVAYLAVEILALPKAGSRWLIAGVLGVFFGLFLHLFVQTAGYRPGFVLAGAAVAEAALIAVLAAVFARFVKWGESARIVRVAASALLVFGVGWFLLRLRG
jgi:hypothetical protein